MAHKSSRIGDSGERLAIQHLKQRGYTVLAQKWRCHYGEIDIIAKYGETFIFVEVKTSYETQVETALANVRYKKRYRLVQAIHDYLDNHGYDPDSSMWQIDLIAVILSEKQKPIIEHIEHVFDW